MAGGWNSHDRDTAEQRGYGWEWRKLAQSILKRDRYLCQCEKCGGKHLPASEVDHILPKSLGGTDYPGNLRAINHDCRKAKTEREAREVRR